MAGRVPLHSPPMSGASETVTLEDGGETVGRTWGKGKGVGRNGEWEDGGEEEGYKHHAYRTTE